MLPDIEHDQAEIQARLAAARQALDEAKKMARDFRHKYADLLKNKRLAEQAANGSRNSDIEAADLEFKAGIRDIEAGRLNLSAEHLDKAYKIFMRLTEAARQEQAIQQQAKLPALLEQAGMMLSRASAANARQYAPQIFQKAKKAVSELRAYADGLSSKRPAHPERALHLAARAHELAVQVKAWRKKRGSHEQLVNQARTDRLRIARTLGLAVDMDDPLADVSADTLVKKIKTEKATAVQERHVHEDEIAQLKQKQAAALAQQQAVLNKQFEDRYHKLIEKQSTLVSGLKESFRVKLERETFEKKRQERVRQLFGMDEAEIFANLDGSLLIRLKGLKFTSGKRDVDKKYFNLLSKLKGALDVYAERKVSIEGHTDNDGDVQKNQVLSLRRAESVRDFLVSAGIDASRLKAVGHGEVRPIASNEFDKGRAMNRRIDIIIAASNA